MSVKMCGEFCCSSGTILGQETLTVLLCAPGQPANLVPLFFKLEVPKGAWKVISFPLQAALGSAAKRESSDPLWGAAG